MFCLRNNISFIFLISVFLFIFGCDEQSGHEKQKPSPDPKVKPDAISLEDLRDKYGFTIPASQETGDVLPPQPGLKF